MGNFSGKPGKPGIFIEKCSLSSKNIMENGQIMDWKTWKTWNFCLKNKWPPCEQKVVKWSIETGTRLIRDVKQAQIRLNLLIGLSIKIVFLEQKVLKWSIETHTRLNGEVKKHKFDLICLLDYF